MTYIHTISELFITEIGHMKKIFWISFAIVYVIFAAANICAAASPDVEIRSPTAEEEGSFLFNVLGQMKFYEENGYNAHLPEQPSFKKWLKMAKDGKNIDRDKFIKEFKKDLFNPDDYVLAQQWFDGHNREVDRAVQAVAKTVRSAGGKVYPQYHVLLTLYGPGGNYNPNTATIRLLVSRERLSSKFDRISTIAHEIVHIGIEESIIKKYQLTHWEKERLTDIICAHSLKGVSKYEIDWALNMPIDDYATPAKLLNLSASMKRYVADYPRSLN